MTQAPPHTPMRSVYGDDYFTVQIAKSDAKVTWEYSRLLTMGGIQLRPDARVLDAACGAAPGLRFFDRRAALTVGLDVAPAALRAARRILPEAALVQADLDQPLPFRPASFDLIILREAIEHVRDGAETLRACRDALRPGGCVALTTPNLWDMRRPLSRVTGQTWSGDADPTHTHIFAPREMAALLAGLGFTRVRVRTGFKPMVRIGGKRLPFPPPSPIRR